MFIISHYLVKWLANESYWGGEFIETPFLKNGFNLGLLDSIF